MGSWFDAIKSSEHLSSAGAWYTLSMPDGYVKKFQPSKWTDLITSDEEFKSRDIAIMDEEIEPIPAMAATPRTRQLRKILKLLIPPLRSRNARRNGRETFKL